MSDTRRIYIYEGQEFVVNEVPSWTCELLMRPKKAIPGAIYGEAKLTARAAENGEGCIRVQATGWWTNADTMVNDIETALATGARTLMTTEGSSVQVAEEMRRWIRRDEEAAAS